MNETETRQLMLLRIQLFGAIQTLKGEALTEFWKLIEEINVTRELYADEEAEAAAQHKAG